MILSAYPGNSGNFGFTAQTWLAMLVNTYLHPGTYYCWFSTHFNAKQNGDDSNPLWIYMTLDRAVAQGGTNNAKVKDVKANLLLVLDRELRACGRASEVPAAVSAVTSAPIELYTPQVLQLDLSKITSRYSSGHQYPDEYCIADLAVGEFHVIVP